MRVNTFYRGNKIEYMSKGKIKYGIYLRDHPTNHDIGIIKTKGDVIEMNHSDLSHSLPKPRFYKIKKFICKIFKHDWVYYTPWLDGEYWECHRCWEHKRTKS